MKSINKAIAILGTIGLLVPSVGLAADGSESVAPPERTTEVVVDHWGPLAEIVRPRKALKRTAKFSVDHIAVDEGAVLEFKVMSRSESGEVLRFRCMAVDSTKECFEKSRQFAFLPGDKSIVLTVAAWPEHVERVSEFSRTRLYYAKN